MTLLKTKESRTMYSLSVIVPVYNSEKYLTKALESIAAQTVADSMQIILVDDGSTDASPAICDEFASKHPDTVVIHRENGGVSAARNTGIKKASGEYIGFVDADDTVAPDYFEKLLTAAKDNNCDMAFNTQTFTFDDKSRTFSGWYPAGTVLEHSEIIDSYARRMLCDSAQNSVGIKIFRRSIINESGIEFPVGVKIGEDKRFVLEFLKVCARAVCIGDCGYFYRSVSTSAMHSDKVLDELMSTYDDEVRIFCSLGLEKNTVNTEKSAYIFYSFADFLQRRYSVSRKQAKTTAKKYFADSAFMEKIDNSLDYIKQNNGRIFTYVAYAFAKRSLFMTLAVLFVQKLINERNS